MAPSLRIPQSLAAALALALAACASDRAAQQPAPPPAADAPPAQKPADEPAPVAGGPGQAADEPWRAQAPTPGAPPELVLPRFERAQLRNGLTVLVAPRKELPLVSVGVAFAAGASQDPRGQEGVSELAYRMLAEGAAGLDAPALDTAFADLGTSLSVAVMPDGALVSTRALTRNLAPALALLAGVVQRPTFAPADFERRKGQTLKELVERLGRPRFLGETAFLPAVFGARHPYGRVVGGTPDSVQRLTLAQVRGFYRRHAGPRAAALVVAGDVTLEQAVALAEQHFGGWTGAAVLPPVPPAPPVPQRGRVVVVPKPGLAQTLVLVGRPGVAAGHADETALDLAATVFGGFFGSRLNMNLREDKGYTYGAGASSDARLGVGPLTVQSAVRADVTGPSVNEFFAELAGMQARPVTARELEEAREGLVRAFPGSFESVEGLAASAAQLFLQRRPLDAYARTVRQLQEATAEQVQRAAERYLAPGTMQVVLVGDPDLIRTQVAPLGLGPLELQPVQGLPGAQR